MDTLTKEVEAGLVKTAEVTSEIADQVVPAMDKLIDKISPAIATLSDKLGTTAEHLWIILVRQSYNSAIGNGIIIIFAIIGLYSAFYSTNVWKKKIETENWDDEGWGGIIAIKCVAGIVSIIVITSNVFYLVQRIINPEFYALQSILKYIN